MNFVRERTCLLAGLAAILILERTIQFLALSLSEPEDIWHESLTSESGLESF